MLILLQFKRLLMCSQRNLLKVKVSTYMEKVVVMNKVKISQRKWCHKNTSISKKSQRHVMTSKEQRITLWKLLHIYKFSKA